MPLYVPNVWLLYYETRTAFDTARDNLLLINTHPCDWLVSKNEDMDEEGATLLISFNEVKATEAELDQWKRHIPYEDSRIDEHSN